MNRNKKDDLHAPDWETHFRSFSDDADYGISSFCATWISQKHRPCRAPGPARPLLQGGKFPTSSIRIPCNQGSFLKRHRLARIASLTFFAPMWRPDSCATFAIENDNHTGFLPLIVSPVESQIPNSRMMKSSAGEILQLCPRVSTSFTVSGLNNSFDHSFSHRFNACAIWKTVVRLPRVVSDALRSGSISSMNLSRSVLWRFTRRLSLTFNIFHFNFSIKWTLHPGDTRRQRISPGHTTTGICERLHIKNFKKMRHHYSTLVKGFKLYTIASF